ncbi:Transposase, Mutator family [Streptomyces sp. AVP053U2]|nr:Transposase, Mutator family [Streptomyces sp. AVP053U2]
MTCTFSPEGPLEPPNYVEPGHQIASRAVAIATGITEDGGREVLGVVLKDAGEMVAATIRTIFAQPSQSVVRAQVDTVTDMLGSQFPRANRCCWKPRTT